MRKTNKELGLGYQSYNYWIINPCNREITFEIFHSESEITEGMNIITSRGSFRVNEAISQREPFRPTILILSVIQ